MRSGRRSALSQALASPEEEMLSVAQLPPHQAPRQRPAGRNDPGRSGFLSMINPTQRERLARCSMAGDPATRQAGASCGSAPPAVDCLFDSGPRMDLNADELRRVKCQEGNWLEAYARGLRPFIIKRVQSVANRIVRDAFRDDVVADVMVNTYDRKAMSGSLLATWDESRDVLAYIAKPDFVVKKVLDAKRNICRHDEETTSLAHDPAAPRRHDVVDFHLVLRDPTGTITKPLIAAALQFYSRINWGAPGHEELLSAVEEAIGPPEPLKRLEAVRAEGMAAIHADIDRLAQRRLKAKTLQTIADLDDKIGQLHANATWKPLRVTDLMELLHVTRDNAYKLVTRSTEQAEEFFIVRDDGL